MTPAQDLPDAEVRARLASGHVAVLGCGGLGSNVAVMLVRASVRRLTLVDFDVVSEDNLNRQHFFERHIGLPKTEALADVLADIGSTLDLRLHSETITAENLLALVEDADVIVEAVDTAEAKALIADVCTQHLPETPLVSVSGLAGYGEANSISTMQVTENFYVVGDLESDIASRVMVAAAHQAHQVVRLLLGVDGVRAVVSKVEVRVFGMLAALRAERGDPHKLHLEIAGDGETAAEIANRLELPHELIEGVFCNHTVYGLDHVIRPGDRIAFVPYGTPGPHRFTLGLYDAGRGNRSDA